MSQLALPGGGGVSARGVSPPTPAPPIAPQPLVGLHKAEITSSCPLPGSTFTSIWGSLLRFHISQPLSTAGMLLWDPERGGDEV